MSEDSDTFEEGAGPSPVPIKEASSKGGSKKKTKRGGPSRKKGSSTGPRCIKCSAVMKEGMRFCNKCGAPQDAPKAQEEEEDEEVIVVEEVVEEVVEDEPVTKVEEKKIVPEPKKDDAVFKAPLPVSKLGQSMDKPNMTSHNKLVQIVDEDGDEEEEDSANTPTNSRVSKRGSRVNDKYENSPKRAVEIESSEEEPPSAVKPPRVSKDSGSKEAVVAAEPKGAELAEMAQFFEKHRLTRERLESSAALLLDKLKMLQKTAPTLAANGVDPAEWEEYDVKHPLFPFLALSQEAYNLYLPRSIDVLKEPVSALVFYREYVAQNVPVIIRNATKHWQSHKWTNAYLRAAMGEKEVSVECSPKGKADFVRKGKFVMPEKRVMKLNQFLDVMEGKARFKGNLYISHQNGNFVSEFGPLHKDIEPHLLWASEAFGCVPEVTNIWIGDGKAFTSCHKDHYENIYIVVSGEKHFTLLPPTDYPWLYEKRYPPARFKQDAQSGKWRVFDEPNASDKKASVPWISVDPSAPDLTKYPLFSNARPYKITVKAGECLYLPSLWYHQVTQTPDAEGKCLAINFWYDMRYASNFNYRNFLVNTWKLWPQGGGK